MYETELDISVRVSARVSARVDASVSASVYVLLGLLKSCACEGRTMFVCLYQA